MCMAAGGEERKEASPAKVGIQIPSPKVARRIIYKVPPPQLADKKHVFHPSVLSLGPYHHQRLQSSPVEKFKDKTLEWFLQHSTTVDGKDKPFFKENILKKINEIRSHYEDGSTENFTDEELAEIMLRDACFILYHLKVKGNHRAYHPLDMPTLSSMYADFFVLENQIPLWILTLLIGLKNGTDGKEALFSEISSFTTMRDDKLTKSPWNDDDNEPLHLLAALRRIILFRQEEQSVTELVRDQPHSLLPGWRSSSNSKSRFNKGNRQFRSVTDLKEKGVCFKPSSSSCLTDIRFHPYYFSGRLQLPMLRITSNTKVILYNMIANEMSLETDTSYDVISYVNFMKSLLETSADVKTLREEGILSSRLGNREILQMFKEINTGGADNWSLFQDVRMRIEEHCHSKVKTWMADLIQTYFSNPWTAIALFIAGFGFSLTLLRAVDELKKL